MGALARRQITETKEAFRTRNVALVGDLVGQGAGIAPINREIFSRAVQTVFVVTGRFREFTYASSPPTVRSH